MTWSENWARYGHIIVAIVSFSIGAIIFGLHRAHLKAKLAVAESTSKLQARVAVDAALSQRTTWIRWPRPQGEWQNSYVAIGHHSENLWYYAISGPVAECSGDPLSVAESAKLVDALMGNCDGQLDELEYAAFAFLTTWGRQRALSLSLTTQQRLHSPNDQGSKMK